MTFATASGKIILFGEHAVVYNQPAIAVPVMQVQVKVEVQNSARPGIWIVASSIDLNSELASLAAENALRKAITRVFEILSLATLPDLKIKITSTIPVAAGLGSGAAVSIALIRALSAHLGHPFSDVMVNDLCFEIEKLHHGSPSGIDNTVITFAKPVYFIKNQPIETFQVKESFTIVIADTGLPAPTKESVGDLKKLWEADPDRWNKIFNQVGNLVRKARVAIENGQWRDLGPLMDLNQALLKQMTVSSNELENLIAAAKNAGALGAKLSGGGRGGNMIALTSPAQANQVSSALLAAGARQTIITTIQ